MMIARCKTNDAFEDSLTTDRCYTLINLRNGSVLIVNDRGQECWYGASRFELKADQKSLSQVA